MDAAVSQWLGSVVRSSYCSHWRGGYAGGHNLPCPPSAGRQWEQLGGRGRGAALSDCSPLNSCDWMTQYLNLSHLNSHSAASSIPRPSPPVRGKRPSKGGHTQGGGLGPPLRRSPGAECAASGAGPGSRPAASPEKVGLGFEGQRGSPAGGVATDWRRARAGSIAWRRSPGAAAASAATSTGINKCMNSQLLRGGGGGVELCTLMYS